ncbi:MAG: hypothetical protein IJP81_09315 [Bacteroidales bacterium]|nr:hypothetical protein [Bacteroidales bacterium]
MRKTIIALLLCLASVAMSAQGRFSFSIETEAGVGIVNGPMPVVTPEFVVQYAFSGGFHLGAGVGVRYERPCESYNIKNGVFQGRSYLSGELDIPLFLRLGYGKDKLYANLDAGYAIGIISFEGHYAMPGGQNAGFFAEPHVGWRFNRHHALALGLLVQQCDVSHRTTTGNSGETLSTNVYKQDVTGAITLRYAYSF